MRHVSDLRQEFELIPAASQESLQEFASTNPFDAVLIHLPIFSRRQNNEIEKLDALATRLPVIILSDRWELDAVKYCGKLGVHSVLDCAEGYEKKVAAISSAARFSGFRQLLVEAEKPLPTLSPRMRKAFELILASFPNVQSICDLSTSLRTHRRCLEREFRKTFGLSYVQFIRVLCMYESWRLMQHTGLDNSEIALRLQYREETHFARDCRKAFNLNPTQLRGLSEQDFFDLLKKSFLDAK
jgi:AraC-like DNA-binding protein